MNINPHDAAEFGQRMAVGGLGIAMYEYHGVLAGVGAVFFSLALIGMAQ